ncbi:MAG: hypothetical protein OEU36_14670 [Gammaproteobacteria bacterium]|nr:hypothetical protein [Gammaproteobacteria bacterium]
MIRVEAVSNTSFPRYCDWPGCGVTYITLLGEGHPFGRDGRSGDSHFFQKPQQLLLSEAAGGQLNGIHYDFPDASADALTAELERAGCAIVESRGDAVTMDALHAELQPYLDDAPFGRTDFAGTHPRGASGSRAGSSGNPVVHRFHNIQLPGLPPARE